MASVRIIHNQEVQRENDFSSMGQNREEITKPKTAVKMLTLRLQTGQIMNIKKERSLLIKELQQVEDISLLRAIKAVLHYGMKNEGRISVEEYNRELEEAEEEIDRGQFTTQEELKKQMKGW